MPVNKILRSYFTDNKIQRPKTKYTLLKERKMWQFANTEEFNEIFDAWNSIPGIRQTRRKNKNKEFTNTFKMTVLVIQAFLAKTIYTKGFASWKKATDRIQIRLPNNFDNSRIDYSRRGLLHYIQNFDVVKNDPDYHPESKSYFVQKNLIDFVAGSITFKSRAKPILLSYCINPPKPIFVDPNPDQTRWFIEYYNHYFENNKQFSANDIKTISKVASKLIVFARENPIASDWTGFRQFGILFESLEDFRPLGLKYFLSEYCWKKFQEYFSKTGFVLRTKQRRRT